MKTLYAYRHKGTGECFPASGFVPFSAKAPATSGLYTHLWRTTGLLEDRAEGGKRWKRLTKPEIKVLAAKEWELVTFEIIPTAELEVLREKAARYDGLCD